MKRKKKKKYIKNDKFSILLKYFKKTSKKIRHLLFTHGDSFLSLLFPFISLFTSQPTFTDLLLTPHSYSVHLLPNFTALLLTPHSYITHPHRTWEETRTLAAFFFTHAVLFSWTLTQHSVHTPPLTSHSPMGF